VEAAENPVPFGNFATDNPSDCESKISSALIPTTPCDGTSAIVSKSCKW
jgi:hypothetical protein